MLPHLLQQVHSLLAGTSNSMFSKRGMHIKASYSTLSVVVVGGWGGDSEGGEPGGDLGGGRTYSMPQTS